MWKISRCEHAGLVVLGLCGRLQSEQLTELKEAFALEAHDQNLALDLKDLRLVDQDVVNFLADCEDRGVHLQNCPAYIRDWIDARKHSETSTARRENSTKLH